MSKTTEEKDQDMSKFYVQKDKLLKRVRGWIHALEGLRQTHLGELKIIRQEKNKLEAKLDDAIIDDNLSLFPEAEVVEPPALTKGQTYWKLIDWGTAEKPPCMLLELAALGNGDFVRRVLIKTTGPFASYPWGFAGTSKETAVLNCTKEANAWLVEQGSKVQPAELKKIAQQIAKVEQAVQPTINPMAPDWKPPRLRLTKIDGFPTEADERSTAIDDATLPTTWPKDGVPEITPLFIDKQPYAVSKGLSENFEQPINELVVIRLVLAAAWIFKTAAKISDAIDGHLCGLVVKSPDGTEYVIDQQSTSLVLWDYDLTPAEDFSLASDDKCRPLGAEAIADTWDENRLEWIESGDYEMNADDTLIWNYGAGNIYINTGPDEIDTGAGIHWLLPLIPADSFEIDFPKFKRQGSLDKSTWHGLRLRGPSTSGIDGEFDDYVIGSPAEAKLVQVNANPAAVKSPKASRRGDKGRGKA